LKYKIEICVFNIKDLKNISKYNIQRVELCTNKSKGGLTPSEKDLKKSLEYNIPIHPNIRPRGGDFVYNEEELKLMIKNINFCKKIGCKGIVFGVLDNNHNVDIEACKKLKSYCGDMSTTFHRAFDKTKNPEEAMEDIIKMGFDRILTSGQKNLALKGIGLINHLSKKSNGRIIIMPGSGIRSSNIETFKKNKSIKEFHSSSYVNGKICFNELNRLVKKLNL
jgi:copper homeostasis protein